MFYDKKSYEEFRDAMFSKRDWIVGAIAIAGVVVSLTLLATVGGCAHSSASAHGFGGILGSNTNVYGYLNVRRHEDTESPCFNGMLRSWERAGCNQVGYEKISDGYYRYWCADEGAELSIDPIRSHDYFVILWNESLHQYSRSLPTDSATPLCADQTAIIVKRERD